LRVEGESVEGFRFRVQGLGGSGFRVEGLELLEIEG
jgi:hypothetical protein